MSSYTLRLNKIEYVNNVTQDEFYAARNVNVMPKLYLYFLEAGIRASGKPFKIANLTLVNLFGASEREIQYQLQLLEELGLITILYEKERTSKKGIGARNVGKRLGIIIHTEELVKYANISRYDEEYKTAQKRGWLRRLINQLPIRLMGFFNHAMAMAKRANDQMKLEALKKRQDNYNKHIKSMQKRHAKYIGSELDIDVDQLDVYTMVEVTAVKDLRLRPLMTPEEAVELLSRMKNN